jgi:hypothetical protein
MKHLKKFNNIKFKMDESGAYPGPSVVGPDNAYLGGTIGGGPTDGQSGSMGAEWKDTGPTSTPTPNKFHSKIRNAVSKESIKRKNALKKLMNLDKIDNFDEYQKKNSKKKEKIEEKI